MCVQAISLISTIMSASLVLKELSFYWRKKAVEPVRQAHSSTKIPTTVKRTLSTQTFKTLIGPVPNLILTFKRKFNKRPKTDCTKNVLYKSHFQPEKNAFNAAMMSTLTMTNSSVKNATMARILTRIFIAVLTLKATSKLTLKKLQNLSFKADQRMNGCTFITKTLKKMMA